MAFNAGQIWDVRTTGSDTTNGGGFNPANANFPTDGTVDANTGNTNSPVFSSASYTFVAGDVGAWVFVKSGTNSIPGWYQIASVSSGKATLTATIGAAYESMSNQPIRRNLAAGIATVGTPTNLTWGLDYSQQNAAEITFTDMVIGAGANTDKFTSAAFPVGKNYVGNTINVTSGTGFTVQRVEVVSTSGTTATCDKALGTASSTGGNGGLGGALGSPGLASGLKIAGNDIFILSGTYSMSTATVSVTNGAISDTTGGSSTTNKTSWCGWNTNRHLTNADATRPTLQATHATSTTTMIKHSSGITVFMNLIADGNSKTAITGFDTSSVCVWIRCKAMNCTTRGFYNSAFSSGYLISCEATACSGTAAFGMGGDTLLWCEAWANTCNGFNTTSGRVIECLSYANTGGSTNGFVTGGANGFHLRCVAYGNGASGFAPGTGNNNHYINCIAEGHSAGSGFLFGQADENLLWYCAGHNNASGNYTATLAPQVIGFISQSAGTFFVDAANGNFALNSTTGQGALLRATGFPSTFPRGLTASYDDIGAAQHQDSGVASTVGRVIGGGIA